MKDNLTLHLTLHSTVFREAVCRFLEQKAQRTEDTLSDRFRRRKAAKLRSLSEQIGATNHESQAIYTLYATAKAAGLYRDSDAEFQPSPSQNKLLARLGGSPESPMAGTTLEEMVSGGVFDFIEGTRQKSGEAAERLREAAQQIKALEARVADREEIAEKLGVTERALTNTEQERDKLAEQVDKLGERLGAVEGGKSESRKKAERKVVEGHPGVYIRETAEGPAYVV